MNNWLFGACILAAVVAVAVGILLVRLLSYHRLPNPEMDPPEFSLSRYAPMAQLLSGEDALFLSAQPNITREKQVRFRRQRRRVFRMYLYELASDFGVLHQRAREIVAESPEERADLVGLLLRLQINFWRAMASIELQLALDWMGVRGVDSRRLLEVLDTLRAAVANSSAPGPVAVS